jgi:hypothetical protein
MNYKYKCKDKSTYDLQERLDMLCSMKAKMYDYRHIVEDEDELSDMVQDQINDICIELDRREAEDDY